VEEDEAENIQRSLVLISLTFLVINVYARSFFFRVFCHT